VKMPQRIIGNDCERTVICLQCKEPVEKRQMKKGKAYCEDCEEDIFGEGINAGVQTSAESYVNKKIIEQRMFEKMMGKMFRRLKL
jgi:hypothetical protein